MPTTLAAWVPLYPGSLTPNTSEISWRPTSGRHARSYADVTE
jgi:hypothetical protein